MSASPSPPPGDPAGPHPVLAGRIAALGNALDGLHRQDHAAQLSRMIRRPGWTTRHEALLVTAMVDHLHAQLSTLRQGHDALLEAADRIGTP
ncbi:MAG: hypothetical protein INR65_08220 [Gluconacetobacter diazotrophicus]|nr:hypothetical protein [Gluconacetobacter diazotrophicus]